MTDNSSNSTKVKFRDLFSRIVNHNNDSNSTEQNNKISSTNDLKDNNYTNYDNENNDNKNDDKIGFERIYLKNSNPSISFRGRESGNKKDNSLENTDSH